MTLPWNFHFFRFFGYTIAENRILRRSHWKYGPMNILYNKHYKRYCSENCNSFEQFFNNVCHSVELWKIVQNVLIKGCQKALIWPCCYSAVLQYIDDDIPIIRQRSYASRESVKRKKQLHLTSIPRMNLKCVRANGKLVTFHIRVIWPER